MSTYQLYPDSSRGPMSCVKKTVTIEGEDVVYCIPFSEDNTDYQEYLKWLAEGNKPKAADKTD